jgi:hypothetical protein
LPDPSPKHQVIIHGEAFGDAQDQFPLFGNKYFYEKLSEQVDMN